MLWLGVLVSGCDRKEPPAAGTIPPDGPDGSAGHAIARESAAGDAVPVDDQDAPGSPPALPKSARVGDWIKVRPVRLATGGEIGRTLQNDERTERLAGFRVERLATCAYRRRGPASAGMANLELFETASAADALGMVLAESGGEREPARSGLIGFVRSVRQAGRSDWFGWQGYHYVHIWISGVVDDELAKAVDQLLGNILLFTPGAPVPALLAFLPDDQRLAGQLWLVRGVRALGGPSGPKLTWDDPDRVDELLGLRGDALLALAGFRVPGSEEVNYVFVAQYPTAEEAWAAHERVGGGSGPLTLPCLLTDPVGGHLAGSFTPEAESVAHVLPEVRRGLPVAEGGTP